METDEEILRLYNWREDKIQRRKLPTMLPLTLV
jgi:hypothetical protein